MDERTGHGTPISHLRANAGATKKQTKKKTIQKTLKLMGLTFPSAVTAAKTVEEYGAQATSPTELFRSNVNRGFLKQYT